MPQASSHQAPCHRPLHTKHHATGLFTSSTMPQASSHQAPCHRPLHIKHHATGLFTSSTMPQASSHQAPCHRPLHIKHHAPSDEKMRIRLFLQIPSPCHPPPKLHRALAFVLFKGPQGGSLKYATPPPQYQNVFYTGPWHLCFSRGPRVGP